MEYRSTSINEVIGRIIRNTRVQDSSYLVSMDEWIPEAMGLMRTKVKYEPKWADVEINFHAGAMPCGLVEIRAVEHRGKRLKYGNSIRSADAPWLCDTRCESRVPDITPFVTVPYKRETPVESYVYDSTAVKVQPCTISMQQCCDLPLCNEWYTTYLNVIQTSFADGIIRVHYYAMAVDDQGMPLIPDNEDYKEAIYWYVREKMVGAGWKDEIYDTGFRTTKFELHAARALGQIRYPSLDQMEMKVNSSTRFIPPANYFENFYSTPNPEPFYGRYDNTPL